MYIVSLPELMNEYIYIYIYKRIVCGYCMVLGYMCAHAPARVHFQIQATGFKISNAYSWDNCNKAVVLEFNEVN